MGLTHLTWLTLYNLGISEPLDIPEQDPGRHFPTRKHKWHAVSCSGLKFCRLGLYCPPDPPCTLLAPSQSSCPNLPPLLYTSVCFRAFSMLLSQDKVRQVR